MTDRIEADYDRMGKIASQFSGQADQIQEMLQKVKGSMDNLENGGWIGRGSDSFFAEMHDEVLPASERLQQALTEASEVSKKIVQVLKDAEEEAGSPFKVR